MPDLLSWEPFDFIFFFNMQDYAVKGFPCIEEQQNSQNVM
jgi:hypothetical protein